MVLEFPLHSVSNLDCDLKAALDCYACPVEKSRRKTNVPSGHDKHLLLVLNCIGQDCIHVSFSTCDWEITDTLLTQLTNQNQVFQRDI